MQTVDKRGEVVAGLGAILSLMAGVVLALVAIWNGSTAIWAVAFQSLCAVGIWLLSLIQLHQQRLLGEERLELAALERERQERLGGAQTIFQEEELDQMDKLAMGRRLRAIERFLVPILAIIVAALHLLAGASIFPWTMQLPAIAELGDKAILNPTVLIFFCGAIAFVTFMFSRYALGMSRLPEWNLLRPGGNFMFGTSVACLATALALLCMISKLPAVEIWVGRCIGGLLIVLAVETIGSFIVDFYRPRVSGEEQRPFYDSRLLGIFSEPGGILRSVANSIDYQFGFRVSETWFYKLMGSYVLWLVLVQFLVIAALTCVTVVAPGHQAVITHLGHLRKETAKAGIHFTWPWPLDRAHILPVDRISRLEVGYEEEEAVDDELAGQPILWTVKHYKKEHQLLVADRTASANSKVPINLLSMNVPIQWRIRNNDADVIRFFSQSQDVERIIESIAYRELTHYAAHTDVLDLLGGKGIEAAHTLHDRIQQSCDEAGFDGGGLGVEIVLVSVAGVHPPPDEEVAKSYEEVVSAYETREATIKGAEGDAASVRVTAAGEQWKELYDAIVEEDRLRAAESSELLTKEKEVEKLLRKTVGGEARERTAIASQTTYTSLFVEKSNAELFETQVAAYKVAPHVFVLREYLSMLEKGLRNVRKYIIAVEKPGSVVYEFDLRPPQEFDALAAEVASMESQK
jgi:regulator of protease activity HflC (stomatin/prohibitin superfamily)